MSGASATMAITGAASEAAATVATTVATAVAATAPPGSGSAAALAPIALGLADAGGGGDAGRHHRGSAAAAAAAIAIGVAVVVLLIAFAIRRARRAQAAFAAPKRASLREAFTRGYRCGDVVAVERVSRKRSSVSYGFGTFDSGEAGPAVDFFDDGCGVRPSDGSDLEDTVYQRPSRPSYGNRRSSSSTVPRLAGLSTGAPGGNDPALVETTLTVPLLGPTAGMVLAQPGRRGPIVVEKVVPGASCYHADPPHRVAVGDVLRGVQTIRIGPYHDLDGVRAMVASQVKLAYRTGRPLRLVVGRPDPTSTRKLGGSPDC